jgi:hypothetical protein
MPRQFLWKLNVYHTSENLIQCKLHYLTNIHANRLGQESTHAWSVGLRYSANNEYQLIIFRDPFATIANGAGLPFVVTRVFLRLSVRPRSSNG